MTVLLDSPPVEGLPVPASITGELDREHFRQFIQQTPFDRAAVRASSGDADPDAPPTDDHTDILEDEPGHLDAQDFRQSVDDPAVVSVIVPVRNAASFLAEALESVLQQDYLGQVEVCLWDDSSTDDSLDIARSFVGRFHQRGYRMKIGRALAGAPARGCAATMNRAIARLATGWLVLFLDSDDIMHPARVTRQVALARRTGPRALLGSRFSRHPFGSTGRYTAWANGLSSASLYFGAMAECSIIKPTWALYRSRLRHVGLFNENAPVGIPEDLMWLYRHLHGSIASEPANFRCTDVDSAFRPDRCSAGALEPACACSLVAADDRATGPGLLCRDPAPLTLYRHHPGATSPSVLEPTLIRVRTQFLQSLVLHREAGTADPGADALWLALVNQYMSTLVPVPPRKDPSPAAVAAAGAYSPRHFDMALRAAREASAPTGPAVEAILRGHPSPLRVIIWGAGDVGKALWRELSQPMCHRIVGFADVKPSLLAVGRSDPAYGSLPVIHPLALKELLRDTTGALPGTGGHPEQVDEQTIKQASQQDAPGEQAAPSLVADMEQPPTKRRRLRPAKKSPPGIPPGSVDLVVLCVKRGLPGTGSLPSPGPTGPTSVDEIVQHLGLVEGKNLLYFVA